MKKNNTPSDLHNLHGKKSHFYEQQCDRRCYLTADSPCELSLLWWVNVEFGFVGSLTLILSDDLQGESIIITDVDLVTVAGTKQTTKYTIFFSTQCQSLCDLKTRTSCW